MTEWAPATDAEVAMRDALRTDDQESYFRILAGVDLLLPVSADALAGLAPLGWGTWSTGGRTHVLAFTSPSALQACLADYTGSARRVAYAELADTWPNLEWWLAVNPGLPIEGYLPAWFVAQLSRGDLRLPTRGPARDAAKTAYTAQDGQQSAVAANVAASRGGTASQGGPSSVAYSGVAQSSVGPGPGPGGAPGADSGDWRGSDQSQRGGSDSGRDPGRGSAADADADDRLAPAAAFGDGGRGMTSPGSAAFGDAGPGSPAFGDASSRVAGPGSGAFGDAGPGSGAFGDAGSGVAGSGSAGVPVGPGGLPVRTPGGVLASGLPSRVPTSPPADQDNPSFPGFGSSGSGGESAAGTAVPAAYRPPPIPDSTGTTPGSRGIPPGAGPVASRFADVSSGAAQSAAAGSGAPFAGPAGTSVAPGTAVPSSMPGASPYQSAAGAGPTAVSSQDPRGPLPTRTPMAQTPPLPSHIASPDADREAFEPGDDLPRRPMTAPAERPASMAAAQALSANRTSSSAPPVSTPSGLTPPVIPGAGGFVPGPASARPTMPPVSAPPAPHTGTSFVPDDDFVPANEVERNLYEAADERSTDRFLSTLLLATVLVPVADNSRPGSSPGEPGFVFRTEEVGGEQFLVVFTSRDRLAEHFAEPARTVGVRFVELISNWPDPAWSFAVNPETPVGATYPGPQVIALASWAADAGLGADPADVDERESAPIPAPQKVNDAAQHATVMQKTVLAEQVDYYLDRGYDRVAGFVHRATEVEHLHTPAELFSALGLVNDGSPYQADAKEAYVLRWPAYRPSLYRIPYGGQSEQALRAMDGWVIERPPFRGNGFAPGEGRDVIAEFKVDSVRLPHGAQLWRMDADGTEKMIAIFDCDAPAWRRVGDQS